MKKLSTVIRYECATSFKYIWIFYLAVFSVITLIYMIAGISTGNFNNVGTNCLEINSMIYIGVLGVLGFKEDFRTLLQNGFTRKYIYLGTFSLFVFISSIVALVDTLLGNALHYALSRDYHSVFSSLYGYGHSLFANWIWLFFLYLFICSFLYLAALIINKIGKTFSIYLGVALGSIALMVPALFRFALPDELAKKFLDSAAKGIGFMADGSIHLMYPVLLLLLAIGVLNAGCYLIIRRTELKS